MTSKILLNKIASDDFINIAKYLGIAIEIESFKKIDHYIDLEIFLLAGTYNLNFSSRVAEGYGQERDQFLNQIVRVTANSGRIDILVTTQGVIAIRHWHNHRRHFSTTDQTVQTLRQIFTLVFPVKVARPRVGKASKVPQSSKRLARIGITRGQIDIEIPLCRVIPDIILQHAGLMFKTDNFALGPGGSGADNHGRLKSLASSKKANRSSRNSSCSRAYSTVALIKPWRLPQS